MLPNQILINLFTRSNFKSEDELNGLCELLCSYKSLHPKKWFLAENKKLDFDQKALIESLSAHGTEIPSVTGGNGCKYEMHFLSSTKLPLMDLKLRSEAFKGEANVKELYDFSGKLAERFHAEYCVIYPYWQGMPDELDGSYDSFLIDELDFREFGPPSLGARTWIGPQLISLLGEETIKSLGVPVRKTSWGGVEIDLMENPEFANYQDIVAQQIRAMAILRETGIFGKIGDSAIDHEAGSNWNGMEWFGKPA